MAGWGFAELEILQAVLNGQKDLAREYIADLNYGERRIFTDQLRQTLALLDAVEQG
jgi:hypothetical protein